MERHRVYAWCDFDAKEERMLISLLILAPMAAHAGGAFSSKTQSVEVRVGPATLADSNITQVYGEEGNQMLFVESGWQLWRTLELDAGLGVLRESDAAIGAESGESSGYTTRLTLLPVSVSGTLRLDLFDGQPVVPFATGGLDYWLWTEQQDTGEGFLQGSSTSGGKPGYHWGFGINLLLDTFSRDRASRAEARWGIEDSYLVVETRTQAMLDEGGLDFGGTVLSVGLKLDL